MKILLLGVNGQVGWEIHRLVRAGNTNIIALGREQLDITHYQDVKKTVQEYSPDILINATAYTAVDRAEEEPEIAFAVNRDAVGNMAQVCALADIPMVHFSTDYVFDGKKKQPYVEDDAPNPLNVYGLSKWEGEEVIRNHLKHHFIIRTSWVFGRHGKNFVKTIRRLAKDRQELRIIDDQWGCPTAAVNIAKTVEQICLTIESGKNDRFGTYHYCDKPETTWYQFAKCIVEQDIEQSKSQPCKLVPISTEQYTAKATRPRYSVLNTNKIFDILNIASKEWRTEINKVI